MEFSRNTKYEFNIIERYYNYLFNTSRIVRHKMAFIQQRLFLIKDQ